VTTLSERVVSRLSERFRGGESSRRSFLTKTAVVGAALATDPVRYLLQPGTAYAQVCGPDADCASGWTVFCCSVNSGSNTCPDGTIAAGWWKADGSNFCGGGPRYIIDCNGLCGSCGCGRDGICAPGCYNCSCRCNTDSCDQRRHCCNEFRYGQCHQELPCVGPVVCRVATCIPPWEWDPSCTTTSATANSTALHHAPCLDTSMVSGFGAALAHGDPPRPLIAAVVGMESTPGGDGYWLVAADGGIFGFGDAQFLGSTGGMRLNRPVVDMTASPTGQGYWLVADDGGIFAFGDAPFLGSTGAIRLNRPIVGMTATPTGQGYWLVADDGGVFAFGDAEFVGSTGAMRLVSPVVGIAATPSGDGYWLAAADGGIFAFGDAVFHGSLGGTRLVSPITSIASTPSGNGYWLAGEDGGVFAFGDATYFGSLGADGSARGRVVDFEARPSADGYWIAGN
jgi:hypothetical protein